MHSWGVLRSRELIIVNDTLPSDYSYACCFGVIVAYFLMNWSSQLWVVPIFVGVSLLIGVRLYASRSGKMALDAVTSRLGLARLAARAPFSSEECKGLSLFSRGNRKWENMFSNNAAMITLLFDYYTFGISLLANVRNRQTVAAFSASMTNLPDFQLTPATALDRIAPKLGSQAIQFASWPDFGKNYWLRAARDRSTGPVRRPFYRSPSVSRSENCLVRRKGGTMAACL